MKDLFTLVTIADEKNDFDAIMDVLRKIHDGKLSDDLQLLNFHRQLPVNAKASIVNVALDRAEITVQLNQALMMKHDKCTLMQSSHFPAGYSVYAFVVLVNTTTGKSIVSRFAYAKTKASQRNTVRVQLHHVVEGKFAGKTGTITGNLIDIAIGGVSIHSKEKIENDCDDTGYFSFDLPTGRINVSAKLLKVIDVENGYTAIFVVKPDGKSESMISQFILNEQVDILRELKDRYI